MAQVELELPVSWIPGSPLILSAKQSEGDEDDMNSDWLFLVTALSIFHTRVPDCNQISHLAAT